MKKAILMLTICFATLPVTVFAQYYYFGRNKVQYEDFDWRVLKTKHFDIYYNSEMEQVAEIGAGIAESAYDRLKIDFNHVITYPIPLIFYNTHIQFQQTNVSPGFIPEGVGGFFEFMKGRVVIPFLGSMEQFRHVINHELTHVFMTTKISRIYRDRRWTAGNFPPLWFIEGIAEFYSTKPDAQANMVMRDAMLNNYFTGLKDIDAFYGSFIMYKFGQSFMEFVSEKYGRWYIAKILENLHLSEDFDEVLAITLRKPVDEIDAEWREFERKKYFPLVQTHSSNALEAKKIVQGGYNFDPNIWVDSSAGKHYLVYTANKDGYSSLYAAEMDSTFTKTITTHRLITAERGSKYEAVHLFEPSLSVSANGLAAFITKSGGSDVIHFYDVRDRKETNSVRFDSIVSISDPSFTSTGELLFRGIDKKGSTDIYSFNQSENKLTRLTNDNYDDRYPSEGFTEDEIIFVSDRTSVGSKNISNLFKLNKNDLTVEQITFAGSGFAYPKLVKNKTELIVANDHDGVFNLYNYKVKNGRIADTAYPVSALYSGIETPFAYKNNTLFFTSIEKLSFDIYRYSLSARDSIKIPPLVNSKLNNFTNKEFSLLSAEAKKTLLKYEKEYTLDYAQSQISTDPVFGTRGGALFSLSDLLGDDKFFMLLFNTAETQSDFLENFNVDIFRIISKNRANLGYGIFNYRGRRYDLRESDEYYYEKSFGSYFLLQYPFSSFDRVETSVSLANINKDIIGFGNDTKSLLLSNSVAYIFDNALWGPSGPLDGTRFRLQLGMTHDIRYGNENYYSLIVDYRHYQRLLYTTSLAFRGSLYWNEGTTTRRYIAGGSWDLRGYPRFGLRGQKFWMTSVELRFPLIDRIALQLPFFGISFSGLRGALFFDAGSLWDKNYKETLGSVGFGFRFNLFNLMVFRYDIGKKIEGNFTRFQDGLFYQFFFGWDF